MKSKCTWIFTLLLAFFIQSSFAQGKTITGVVTDQDRLPLPGASVMIEGTTTGTNTDVDGKFSINVAEGQTLVFSFVGTQTQKIRVGASSRIDVQLMNMLALEDVVVEGYRSTSRPRSNAAVTTVTAETIETRPNVSFVQSLQGQIPGLNISTGSGSPGSSNTTVILRGRGSINGNIEPLYVIDGVPSNLLNFRTINSNDIESVSVLKDAGATSQYGNRGANGVIVVRTKRGRYNSALQVRYTGVTGFTKLQEHDYRLANSTKLLGYERARGIGEGATGGPGGIPLTDAEIAGKPNTSWQDVFFSTGISMDHNLSLTQGTENTNSFTSLGYFEQEGIVPGTNIKRFSVRSNFNGKTANDKFNYGTNLYAGYSRRYQLEQETRTDINGNVLQNPLQGMLSSLPYLDPAVYQNGRQLFNDFGQPSFRITPYMLMDYLKNIYNRYDEIKLLINGSASYKLTKDLTFGVNGGIDYTSFDRVFSRLPQSYLAIVAAEAGGYGQFPGLETQQSQRDFAFNGNTRLNYKKVFGEKHTVDVSVLTEYYRAFIKTGSFSTTGLNDRTYSPGAGTGYVPFNPATPNLFVRTIGSGEAKVGLFSYFANADYDYDSKYGVGLSIRRDASNRFVDDNKWGTFWSVSGRWNLDQEAFLKDTFVTELKLRASIGTAGNQAIGGGTYALPNPYLTLYGTSSGYGNQTGVGLAQVANPTVRWETVKQTNLGVDFVLDRRLSGTVDLYRKETIDLYQTLPQSAINGSYGISSNVGGMLNSGVEVLLNYDVFKPSSEFQLRLTANGSYNKNEMKDVPGGQQLLPLQIQTDGGSAFQYFLVKYAGINPVNGNNLFYDIDGNLTETPTTGDRVATGKSALPTYQGGFGFDASYKGFFLTTQFTFVKDIYRFDFDLANLNNPENIGSFPVSDDFDRAWTPTNTRTDMPSLFASNTAGLDISDRFLRDASYLRLKFISFGYNVPSKFLERTFMKSARFYAQAENLLTWTNWRGFDPESNAASTFGGYPSPRVVSVGVDLSF